MNAAATNNKIVMSFAWEGPHTFGEKSLKVGVVNLLFKGAQTEIRVHIPENTGSLTPKKLFYERTKGKTVSHPEALSLTIEQIKNLTIQVGFVKEGSINETDCEVKLETPGELKIGEKYCLLVTSRDRCLQASLVKEEMDKTSLAPFSDLATLKADLKKLHVDKSEADRQTLHSISVLLENQKNSLRQLEQVLSNETAFDGSPRKEMEALTNTLRAEIEKMEKQKDAQIKLIQETDKKVKDLLADE